MKAMLNESLEPYRLWLLNKWERTPRWVFVVLANLVFFFFFNFLVWLFVYQLGKAHNGYSTYSYWDQISVAGPLTLIIGISLRVFSRR